MSAALIMGIAGQDGSFLAEYLIACGYRVVGTVSPRSAGNSLPQCLDTVETTSCDSGMEGISSVIQRYQPAEIYNFAAFSSGAGMNDRPLDIADLNGMNVARILECIRTSGRDIRFCQASSSEMFGECLNSPQDETTCFRPRSAYGVAKMFAHEMVKFYRKQFGLFACSAILYNHESPRRRAEFVTRKITRAAAQIKMGFAEKLVLGDLDARRDWSFAGDIVKGMWLMLQAETADDYVLSSGVTHSVREVCEIAFSQVGLDYRKYVSVDPAIQRPRERVELMGNPAKAERELGWKCVVSFPEMIRSMVEADLAHLQPNRGVTKKS